MYNADNSFDKNKFLHNNNFMSPNTNEKWLIVSCLQKSIRKGFEDIACLYAGQLYELDKTYLIHKMRTILLEDIFLANTDLINEFFIYANRKNHKKIEIINFIKLLSQSVKDRTAYDILEITKVKNIQDYKIPEEILKNDKSVIIDKLQSAKQILNQLVIKNPLHTESFHIEKLLNDYEITENKKIIEIIKNIYVSSKDSNFLLLGFLEKVYQQEKLQMMGKVKTGDIITYQYKPELLNNKWLIDGIDWHTKEGKSAIQEFMMENSEIKKYLLSLGVNENIDLIIGLLLFKTIGEEVDKRLFYPTAVMAAKLSKKLELEKMIGHKEFNQNEIFIIFKNDYPLLKTFIQDKFKMPDPDSFPF